MIFIPFERLFQCSFASNTSIPFQRKFSCAEFKLVKKKKKKQGLLWKRLLESDVDFKSLVVKLKCVVFVKSAGV